MAWMSRQETRPHPPQKLLLISATQEQADLLKKVAENVGIQVVAELDTTEGINKIQEILKSAL